MPELGRGTVYATLAELTELGLLAALGSPEPVRYETNVSNHSHFRCKLCLRLFDVQIGRPSVKSLEAAGHRVERMAIVAEGVCAECEADERGLEDGIGSILGQRQVSEGVLAGLACSRLETEIGPLALAASADGIVRIAFEDHADFDPSSSAPARGGGRRPRATAWPTRAPRSRASSGLRAVPDDLLDEGAAELIDTPILDATRRVAYGATLSYERLGGELGPTSAAGRWGPTRCRSSSPATASPAVPNSRRPTSAAPSAAARSSGSKRDRDQA